VNIIIKYLNFLNKNFIRINLLILVFLLIKAFSIWLEKDQRLNYKYTYYAIPISISNIIGNKYDYSGYKNIREIIKNDANSDNKKLLNYKINKSFEDIPKGDSAISTPTAEDIGLVDFVTYSFYIFGKDKTSIQKFTLLIFVFSILLYFISFYKKQELLLIPIILISITVLAIENFSFYLNTISFDRFSDNRNFSILATIPFIHIILFLFNQKKNIKNLFFATLQILLLNFLFYCRTSI